MLTHLLLIDSLEVARQALCLDGVHHRGTLLDALGRVSINEAEVLERLRVSRRKFEVCWDVPAQFDVVFLCAVFEKVLHAFELASLPLCKVVFVRRPSVEGKRIVRELRMLLVEDVILAVLPVGERCLVRTGLLDGLRCINDVLHFLLCFITFLSSELGFVSGCHVHLVRVDDLGLLLEVEGLLVVFYLCCRQLAVVVLAVVGEEGLGVGVANESVRAAGLTCPLVPSWQSTEWRVLPDGLGWAGSIETILSVVFAKFTVLLALRSHGHL